MKKIIGNIKIAALSFLVLLLRQVNCEAQAIAQLKSSFNQYQQETVQEKVFVHTDRSAYLPGEIIWFKIYVVDASFHKPFDLSRVVYVDVLDDKHNAVLQAKIAVKYGLGSGSLYIPVVLSNGNYQLRAYTSWMKNFNADYYFEKTITIVNPLKSPVDPAKETAAAYDVQFFPEGGNLVTGIASKVAFKVTAPDGNGLNAYNGVVVDQHNDTLVRFQPLKYGIGNFTFTPTASNNYRAIIKTGNKQIIKDLPAIHNQGYVMQLKDKGNQLEVVVNSTSGGEVSLFAHTRQLVKVAATMNLNSGTANFLIDKAQLGEGISHITIFNSARQPVCERLYFKRPKIQLSINAAADQTEYATRKKVSINISAKTINGLTTPVNLSLSVYRVDSLQQSDEGDIFSYLWLKSDLRGGIESPAYYLKNSSPEADAALDNLMLSQGWRRFQWNDILSAKKPAFSYLPEYNDHLIMARAINTVTNTPAKDIVAYLSVPGKRVQLYISKSDSLGRLIFNTKQLYGPGEVVAQTNSERDSTFRIDVLSPFSEQYSKYNWPKFSLNGGMQQSIELHSMAMQVQNLYAGKQTRRFYDARVDSSGFYAKPFKTYLLDNYTRFTTMEEVLREYIREVNVVQSRGRYHIKVLNEKGFLDGDPLVLLDDVPVFNINKVIAIDPLKVRKLEVVNERYFYGPSVSEGVISLTTYKGDLGGVEMDPHAVVLDYEGLQQQRQFYSPVYDTEKSTKSRIPDFRNLLFWSPEVSLGQYGKAEVTFYSSDQTGKYVGLIQGISNNGDAGSQYFTFEVK